MIWIKDSIFWVKQVHNCGNDKVTVTISEGLKKALDLEGNTIFGCVVSVVPDEEMWYSTGYKMSF